VSHGRRFADLAPNVQGALWMLASAVSFTVMASLVKLLGADYPAPLQAFYRQFGGFLVVLPLILKNPRGAYTSARPAVLIYRALVGTVGMILMFYAYQKLPLADANALSFTRVLWMVPLAVFVLRETVGPVRIGAAIVGFGGVLLMLQSLAAQGHGALGLPQIAALASALLFATTVTGMKSLMRDHAPIVVVAWGATLGLILTIPMAIYAWRWPTMVDLGLLLAMGAMGTITQSLMVKGLQIGEAAAISPVDYTRIVFAMAVGFLVFHEVPSLMTLVGAAIVVASTLFLTWREQRIAKAKVAGTQG